MRVKDWSLKFSPLFQAVPIIQPSMSNFNKCCSFKWTYKRISALTSILITQSLNNPVWNKQKSPQEIIVKAIIIVIWYFFHIHLYLLHFSCIFRNLINAICVCLCFGRVVSNQINREKLLNLWVNFAIDATERTMIYRHKFDYIQIMRMLIIIQY